MASACGSKTTHHGQVAARAEYCATFCDRLFECDDGTNAASCLAACESDIAGGTASLRPEFAAAVAACLKEQGCSAFLSSSALGACVKQGETSVPASPSGTSFCEDLASKLESCMVPDELPPALCQRVIVNYSDAAIARARACLDGTCADVVDCVNGKLSPITPVGNEPGTGGAGPGDSCPPAVTCLDDATAGYCDSSEVLQKVVCSTAMAQQGIVSNGCLSDSQSDGCTIDAFSDPDCEAGTPAFAVCAGLAEADLVNVYVACFQGLGGADAVVACYRDYVNAAEGLVDCDAAATACAVP